LGGVEVPKRSEPSVLAGESNVADHVELERERRGWSTGELAKRVTEAGCPISQSAIWRIEKGNPRRKISVDELVAFGRVFGMSVDDLLLPVSSDVPSDLIELYVNKWVDSQTHLRAVQVRVDVDLGYVVSAAWHFPGADQLIRGLIRKRIDETLGMRGLDSSYLSRYEKDLNQTRESGGPYFSLGATEIIVAGRHAGKSDDEIKQEASRWGVEAEVQGVLDVGVVHFVEPDFAGHVPLSDLVIQGGKVTRSPAGGGKAELKGDWVELVEKYGNKRKDG
jgi:hypothetical protein